MVVATLGERYRGMIKTLLQFGKLIDYRTSGGSDNEWDIAFEGGRVIVKFESDDFDPFMNLYEIITFPQHRKKGYASKVMKIICDTADLWGVSMELDVNPHEMPYRVQEAGYGKTRMTPEMIEKMDIMNENQLKKFYSRFGFEQEFDGDLEYFVRYPMTL